MLIGRRNMANILTFSRKSHNPIENLILLQWAHNCEFFGFDRLALENEILIVQFEKLMIIKLKSDVRGAFFSVVPCFVVEIPFT